MISTLKPITKEIHNALKKLCVSADVDVDEVKKIKLIHNGMNYYIEFVYDE